MDGSSDGGRDDSKRHLRNLSEKKRRDQFNLLVTELSSMLHSTTKKVDKSTILKSAISYLKNHNESSARARVHDIHETYKPPFLSNDEFTYLVLEAMEGFIMIFSITGRIYYVSEGITAIMGQAPVDIMNNSIFDLCHEADRPYLCGLLQNPGIIVDPMHFTSLRDYQIKFQCNMRNASVDNLENYSHELMQFSGYFRNNNEEAPGLCSDQDSRILFVCTGHLMTPKLLRDVTLMDANHNEFTSRHSLEWKFLFLDHRASPIIGYLPFEVLGTSGYDYYHFDDYEKIIMCHEALMVKGALTSCYYRFLTKGQQWIWLQTRFYITYHQWNSKPEFVVCTHRVVSLAEVSAQEQVIPEDGCDFSNQPQTQAPEVSTVNTNLMPPTATHQTCMISAVDAFFNSYQDILVPPSATIVRSTSTVTAPTPAVSTWGRAPIAIPYQTASTSRDNHSIRISNHNLPGIEPSILPQHNMGAQYLQPVPFTNNVTYTPLATMAQPTLQIIVSAQEKQMQMSRQDQLQKKHMKLSQLIIKQQEELRQVKEQLVLAKLGMGNGQIEYQQSTNEISTSNTAPARNPNPM